MPTFTLRGCLRPRFAKRLLNSDRRRVTVTWSKTRASEGHTLQTDPPHLAVWLEMESETDGEPIDGPIPFSAEAPFLASKESALMWLQLRVFTAGYEASGDTRFEWEDDPPGTVY